MVPDSFGMSVTLREISATLDRLGPHGFCFRGHAKLWQPALNEFAVQPKSRPIHRASTGLLHRLESWRVVFADAARAEPESIEIADPAASRANSAAFETTRIPAEGKLVFGAATRRT
jgi:hypothetical protein